MSIHRATTGAAARGPRGSTPVGLAVTLALVAWSLAARPAASEPYAAVFAGLAASQDQEVEARVRLDGFTLTDGTFERVGFDRSAVVGGKVGYFLERRLAGGNLGIELEVARFSPDVSPQVARFSGQFAGDRVALATPLQRARLDLTGVGLNLLYRVPLLPSAAVPRGRFHPYVGVGADLVVADFSTRTTPLDVNQEGGDTDVQPALQGMVGVKWFLTRWLALFAEYQYLQVERLTFRSQARGTRGGVPVTERAVDRTDFATHLGVAGLAVHW